MSGKIFSTIKWPCVRALVIGLSILSIMLAPLGRYTNVQAAGSNYAASDVLGQLTGGSPDFTTQTSGQGSDKFEYPDGTVVDTVRHRLFVADCGFRILEFDMDASNNLLDHTADHVLGQAGFVGSDISASASTTNCPAGLSFDEAHNRLFTIDWFHRRVLVYEFNDGISNGMDASYVLGEPDFTTGADNTTQNGFNNLWGGTAYDPQTEYLYVDDGGNSRVMVFDLSGGISNGMDASYVLGQPDFTTSNSAYPAQNSLSYTYALAVDSVHHRLFVGDMTSGNTQLPSRVMIFDTSNLSNGMNASFVLGQSSFTSTEPSWSNPATPNHFSVSGLAYDPDNQRLFVEDEVSSRVLVFDVTSVTNGENAVGVLGSPDFVTRAAVNTQTPSQTNFNDAEGLSDYYDRGNNRLYVSDSANNRVMIFNFAKLAPTITIPVLGATFSQSLGSQTQGVETYSVTSGALPDGLNLNASTGLLSGTPTKAGTFNFTIKLVDDNGAIGSFSDTKSYTLTIAAPSAPNTGSSSLIHQALPAFILAVACGIALLFLAKKRFSTTVS